MLTDLAVRPVSDTIYRLAAERRSGDLQVRSGRLTKVLFLDHGRIVFAGSSLKKDRLGEALVALGRITDDQFQQISGLMKEDRTLRFGDALIASGLMDKKAVGSSVAQHVARIVVSTFDLQDGVASFDERPCGIPVEFMVSVSVHRLLLAGINTMTNADLILAGLGDLEREVKLASVPPFTFAIEKCPAEQRELLEKAKSRVTVRRLASTREGLSTPRLRAAYGFLASGILQGAEDGEDGAAGRPAVQTESGGFLLSPLQREPAPAVRDRAGDEERTPSGPSAEASRPAPVVVEDAPAASVTAGAAAAPATPEPPAPSTSSSANSMELQRLVTQANVCLMVSDYPGAVRSYAKIVDLEPDVASHRARLAMVMARSPSTMRQAERQFVEAIRLDPDNAEVHYQFALYYRAMKVASRAIAEFRTVVRLDPRHAQARAELEAAAPGDSVLTTLKKLIE